MNTFDPNHIHQKAFFIVGQKAVISNEAGLILVLQRSQKSGNGGKWSLAGGALEKNEEPIEGLKREIQEETNLSVSDIKPFSVLSYQDKDNDQVLILGYTCKTNRDVVTLNWEHDQFKWVSKEEALQMDLGEHARFFIEQLEIR